MKNSFSDSDRRFMSRALQLAKLGGSAVAPNPMVGAVIVHKDVIIGEGYHRNYGEAHAEVNAVNSTEDTSLLSESTLYVTLEPCAHHGKTPPCADLIVRHQFDRVVIACRDSFSAVAGKGIERIKHAGIRVEVGLLEQEARWLNRRFFTFHERRRPYVILKWAQTADGFIDRSPHLRQKGVNWITQPATQLHVHQWRSQESAILVGYKTVINDDPSLTVRAVGGENPMRVILDPNSSIRGNYKVLRDGVRTLFFVRSNAFNEIPEHIEVVEIQPFTVQSILGELWKRSLLSVFVEGGATTLQHFIDEGAYDEARVIAGENNFKEGLQAPQIEGLPNEQKTLGTDTIHYFYRS
ncbi:MAG: bifunctional diaminohydroxyphosphoribosylaminopyrimidine deaminase/5-amino-6-(5-phosphoribosylamino)uracil reductase RibD [Bacteroidota bacterium]